MDIEFLPDVQCDNCDTIGVYDLMGDYLCPYCFDKFISDDDLEEEEKCHAEEE